MKSYVYNISQTEQGLGCNGRFLLLHIVHGIGAGCPIVLSSLVTN